MIQERALSKPQERWNDYGTERLHRLRTHPDRFLVNQLPSDDQPAYQDITRELGSLQDKDVLELGCGFGQLSVFLAKQGARVTGIDIGGDLIRAATLLAAINGVSAGCTFRELSIADLPFAPESFDLVVGSAILHHLSEVDLRKAVRDTHRVLRPGCTALFYEPVENSRLFDFVQNLIPVGKKGTATYRPSILNRQAWRSFRAVADDRALTTGELLRAGKLFASVQVRALAFLIRLERLLGQRFRGLLTALDGFLLEKFPATGYLAQRVCVRYRK